MRKDLRVCVPTYNRRNPLILKMLEKSPSLELDFFVRGELYDEGFYDELSQHRNVRVHSLGYGLKDLGETRQRIVQWCKDNHIKYCAMFDDGIYDITDSKNRLQKDILLERCIWLMENDPLKERVIGFSFHKRLGLNSDGRLVKWDDSRLSEKSYFLTMPAQAVLIDIDKMFEHNISYKSLDECGLEDCAFFADCVKEGLIFCSRKSITIDGVVPNQKKVGGSHTNEEDVEKRYDKLNKQLMSYIGNMYGVYVEKRYRKHANGLLSYVIFDTDYFREVLCEKPEENKHIIETKFMREY